MDELIRSIEEQQKPLRDTFDHITRVQRVDADTIQIEGIKDGNPRTERLKRHDAVHSIDPTNLDTLDRALRDRMSQETLPLLDPAQRRLTCLLCGEGDIALSDNPDAQKGGMPAYLQRHAVNHIGVELPGAFEAGGGEFRMFAVRHDLPGGVVEWDLPEPTPSAAHPPCISLARLQRACQTTVDNPRVC